MQIKETYLIGIFILCNLFIALLFYWAALRPINASAENMRRVVSMQEQRLDVYERQRAGLANAENNEAASYNAAINDVFNDLNNVSYNDDIFFELSGPSEPNAQPVPLYQITEVLGEIERLAYELNLAVEVFSSHAPVEISNDTSRGFTLYDIRVSAVYRGQTDELQAFVQLLDTGATRVCSLHMHFSQGYEATLRLDFSLFAFFSDSGIE